MRATIAASAAIFAAFPAAAQTYPSRQIGLVLPFVSSWQGVLAPAGTPKDIIDRLNGEIAAMLQTPDVKARITREGADPVGSSPEQWSARFKNEVEKWAKVARSAGLSSAN